MNKKLKRTVLIALAICLIAVGIVSRAKKGTRAKKVLSEAEALYQTALSWEAKLQNIKAIEVHQQLIRQFPEDKQAVYAWYNLGRLYEQGDLWLEAKAAYAKIIADFPNFQQISDVEKRLWDLNVKVLFSPSITDSDIIYKVEPGDTLAKIAARYNTTANLIMRSNNLNSNMIRPGERLKISTAKYSVIIDKSQNTLTLKADDRIFKVYSVATGEYNYTPIGNFKIAEKLKNPDWYKKGEGIIPANSPANILGTRWLGLSEPQYGIHGGASLEDLGKQITNGCIRMTNIDVEELFTILSRGTEVIIVD